MTHFLSQSLHDAIPAVEDPVLHLYPIVSLLSSATVVYYEFAHYPKWRILSSTSDILKKLTTESSTAVTEIQLLSVPAGAAPSPEQRPAGHRLRAPTCHHVIVASIEADRLIVHVQPPAAALAPLSCRPAGPSSPPRRLRSTPALLRNHPEPARDSGARACSECRGAGPCGD